jgi:2-dehydro-3-deoxygluconokinase
LRQFLQGESPRVVAAGECMLELARHGDLWRLGAAGDSFNTALYLRRLGAMVRYFTALGLDPFSEEMLQSWAQEGMDTALVLRHPDRLPGLYAIRTDDAGERTFYYWRQQAAVRQLFQQPDIEAALQAAADCDLLYLTGITLSLFRADDRRRWTDLATEVRRRGGVVAFDPNYRPKGWSGAAEARAAMDALAPQVDIVLTTRDDESMLFGHHTAEDAFRYWRGAGVGEVVVKLGAEGAEVLSDARQVRVPVERAAQVVDSTAAGDSFNAAYLMSRLRGDKITEAARAGNRLAGAVVQVRGAILPADRMP